MEKAEKRASQVKYDMSKKPKILIILVALVALSLLSAFWAVTNLSEPPPGVSRFPIFPGDIEPFYIIGTVISTINVTLLIILLIMYVQIYRKTRSEFTIGLIIFSAVLLLYALASSPIVRSIFGFRAVGLGPFAMLPDLFTCVALVILLYLTVKY
jgi:hypothetical protein